MSVRARAVLGVAAVLALGGCRLVCGAPVPPEHQAPPREPLPQLLAPLRWETPLERLGVALPGAEDEGIWWGGPGTWYTTREFDTKLRALGRASMYVRYIAVGDAEPVVDELYADVDDPRPGCRPWDVAPACRASAPPEVGAAFDRASRELEREYGKGTQDASAPAGGRGATWARNGFAVSLTLSPATADRSWFVRLAVERAPSR